MFLGRHFGCRPLDPTLDIWSNFVKKRKKKKKHFTSLQCLKGSQGFPKVTNGYPLSPGLSAWLSAQLSARLFDASQSD